MGVTTYTKDVSCSVHPSRLFKALFIEHDLLPKLMPQHFKSYEILEGDGGAGTIKKITFSETCHMKYVKHKIEVLDKEAHYCKYTLFEGDKLKGDLDKIVYEFKFEATTSGCICKTTRHYHAKEGVEIKEEDVKAGQEKASELFKVVEKYLTENPHAYA